MQNRSFAYHKVLLLVFSLMVLVSTPVKADIQDLLDGLEKYRSGLLFLQTQQWKEAAITWVKLSEKLLANNAGIKQAQQAAFAQLLATIVLEREGDPASYTSWGATLQYYLQGRTTWNTTQTQLKQYIQDITQPLAQADPDTGIPSLNNKQLFLIQLNDQLDFLNFNGPRPGLVAVEKSASDEDTITIGLDYYARPLALIDQEQQSVESRSKYAGASVVDISENNTGLSGRGVPSNGIQTDIQKNDNNDIRKGSTDSENQELSVSTRDANLNLTQLGEGNNSSRTIEFTDKEQQIAQNAWRYFINNLQANTGMYNSVNQYPRATLWDMGSALAAMVSAEQLGVLSRQDFQQRMKRHLRTLQQLPLYNGELPNREYNTKNGKMIDIINQPSATGSGWSALDIARTLIWFKIIFNWYPEFRPLIEKIIAQWDFQRLAKNGQMNGVWNNLSKEKLRQEGRLGYEQYAAMGFLHWGITLPAAFDYANSDYIDIYELSVRYDTRNHSYLTSEPFVLSQLELGGIDVEFQKLASIVYEVQKRHWQRVNLLTAYSEDSIHQAPWFLYNTLYNPDTGQQWSCVAHNGKPVSRCSTLSTKVAFSWAALYGDDYSQLLRSQVEDLFHPKYGYYAGRYEDSEINKALTVNTNAVILEALLYMKRSGRPFLDSEQTQKTQQPVVKHSTWEN